MNEDVSELVSDMFETMYNADGGGLAACQIGITKRLFVIDLPDQEYRQVFVNPVMLKKFGDEYGTPEGCLSIPGLKGMVKRPGEIQIEYYDEKWVSHIKSFMGIKATVIQHEFDHLEGMMWIDRTKKVTGTLIDALHQIMHRVNPPSYPFT